jgi:GMP synthase-like glutamine amidotransferase
MHTHEEHYHPWLREENLLIQRLLDQRVPFLGICLGGQLLAKASHTPVTKASEPEIGWFPVELTGEAARDPIFSGLPERFMAYQWHHYRFDLPGGAVPLARSAICLQAFRLGELAWGLQFHCEVTREMVFEWAAAFEAEPDADRSGYDGARMRAETPAHIGQWNEIGRELSGRFLAVAERAGDRRVSRV